MDRPTPYSLWLHHHHHLLFLVHQCQVKVYIFIHTSIAIIHCAQLLCPATNVCVSHLPPNSNSSSSLLFLRLQFLFICTIYINCDGIDTQCLQLLLLLPCFSLQALVVRCAPLRSLTAAAVMCTCSNRPL